MEIVRLCPFSVATVVWGERHGACNLTIAVKATFTLPHREEAMLAPRQDTAHGDVSWDHNPQAALFAPSDFVPRKNRIDVVFSGRTFAPGGDPTELVIPRLRVGHFEKKVRVVGPRVWVQGGAGLRPSAPERFLAAPMRYELAAMQGENLSGIQTTAPSTGSPLPRIESVEEAPQFTPGFGPLPVQWRAENRGAPESALAFARRLRTEPAIIPANLDFGLFNSAPLEQQLDELEPAPVIQLDHLCRKIPRLETRLPKIRPRVFYAVRTDSKPYEVDLRLDTIWIDGLRMLAVVSWRGTTTLAAPEEYALGRIVVAAESPEMMVSLEDVESPPVPQEDSSPRPILPRPFEGEIAEDEGYTLLPNRPVRTPVAFAEPSGLPPQARESSVPIPPSGERRIEDRASTVLVGASLPGPSEIVRHFGDELRTTATATSWEGDELLWPGASLDEPAQPETSAAAETDDTPPPATARTGSVPPTSGRALADFDAPATPRNALPEPAPPTQAPSTQAPSTQKTGSVSPPPLTASSPTMHAPPRPSFEASPMTERAPGLLGWDQPKALLTAGSAESGATELPLDGTASFVASSGSIPTNPFATKVMSVDTPKASSVTSVTSRGASMSSSGDRRRPSTSLLSAQKLTLAELPLELCAAVAARIDRCPNERASILEQMGLSEATYAASEQTWTMAMRTETEQGRGDLRAAYERAYVAQLETERGEIDISDYAHLMVSVEFTDADAVLADLGLPRCALVRIERVWQERMAADVAFCARVRQAMASTRRAFSRVRRGQPASADTDPRTAAYAEGSSASSRPRSSDR